MLWEIEWSDGSIDIVEDDDEPDEETLESGIDADSPNWGKRVKEIRRVD